MPLRLPQSGRCGSGGSGRAPKTMAGRKPVAKPVVLSLPSPVAPLGGDLQAVLGSAGVAAKAKRSKATPVVQRPPSARSKAALCELSSLESAQLRLADKNLETSGKAVKTIGCQVDQDG